MIVLGLTGSIGMGKSTAGQMLRRLGVPLFDADRAVHRLLAPGGAAVGEVEAAFPGVAAPAGGIDRTALGRRVFGDPAALRRLERILHPKVAAEERRFLKLTRGRRAPVVVLEIPLLFEVGAERRCDRVLVISAAPLLQRQRVLRREGMTEARFAAILRQQMPDRAKRRRADFVVQSGLSRALTLRRLKAILRGLREGDRGRHARGRARYRNDGSRPG